MPRWLRQWAVHISIFDLPTLFKSWWLWVTITVEPVHTYLWVFFLFSAGHGWSSLFSAVLYSWTPVPRKGWNQHGPHLPSSIVCVRMCACVYQSYTYMYYTALSAVLFWLLVKVEVDWVPLQSTITAVTAHWHGLFSGNSLLFLLHTLTQSSQFITSKPWDWPMPLGKHAI